MEGERHEGPHHNFVVIAPMVMKFGTGVKLDPVASLSNSSDPVASLSNSSDPVASLSNSHDLENCRLYKF